MPEREELARCVAELRPFQEVSRLYFYGDTLLAGAAAWVSLYLLSERQLDAWSAALLLLSYLAFYRGNAFIHEVVHFGRKVKGISLLYNLMFGFPNGLPSYIHEPHKFHHLPHTFGTSKDPEYLFQQGMGRAYFFRPFWAASLAPLLLILRFGIVPLVSWAFPERWRALIYRRFSTLVVDPGYVREERRAEDRLRAFRQDIACAIYFCAFLAAWLGGALPTAFFGWRYLIAVAATATNMYRARVAHRYDNRSGAPLSPLAALRDSTTIEGGLLSELWAPLGLKYHSLHHLAPQIPYHNLGRAHRFLRSRLSPDHPYRLTILPTFWSGLRQYRRVLLG